MKKDLTIWEKEWSVLFESDGATYVLVLSNMKVYRVRGEVRIKEGVTLKLQETDLSLDDFDKENESPCSKLQGIRAEIA